MTVALCAKSAYDWVEDGRLLVVLAFSRHLPVAANHETQANQPDWPIQVAGPSARTEWSTFPRAAMHRLYAKGPVEPTFRAMDTKHIAQRALTEVGCTETPFDLDEAYFFAVLPSNEIVVLGTHGDVYAGLEVMRDNLPNFHALLPPGTIGKAEAIGIVSCGWAAPLDSMGDSRPASASPLRKRCRLAAVVDVQLQFAVAAQFECSSDDIVVDDTGGDIGIPRELRMTVEALLAYRFADQIAALDPGEELEL